VGPRTYMDTVEENNSQRPPGIESQSSSRPARRQSLYGLSYPSSEF